MIWSAVMHDVFDLVLPIGIFTRSVEALFHGTRNTCTTHLCTHTHTHVKYIAKELPTLALCLLYPEINKSGLSPGISLYNEINKALVQLWHWNYSNSELYIAVSFYAINVYKGKIPFSRWKFYRNVESTMYVGILLWNVCLLHEGRCNDE